MKKYRYHYTSIGVITGEEVNDCGVIGYANNEEELIKKVTNQKIVYDGQKFVVTHVAMIEEIKEN